MGVQIPPYSKTESCSMIGSPSPTTGFAGLSVSQAVSNRPSDTPQALRRRWTLLLVVLVLFGACLRYAMNFYGLSLDVAHHYALVATIMRDWHVGPTPLPHLGEMNYYPNLSHWVAALFGSLLGSG